MKLTKPEVILKIIFLNADDLIKYAGLVIKSLIKIASNDLSQFNLSKPSSIEKD